MMLERTTLDAAGRHSLLSEATRILGRCTPPVWGERSATAELVVGEVQSGKTMSFTALTALARDAGYPLVVILAGTKNNLRAQTFERLRNDLAMVGVGGLPSWSAIENPGVRDAPGVARRITSWKDPKRNHVTTVAVVLKQGTRLQQARQFLEKLAAECGAFPALVIDDEADQAGLNLSWKKLEESPTYRSIKGVRAALPSHSYVLYTATPQALLLLSLADTVSPRTVTVLRRGEGYVGGPELFVDRKPDFVRQIDDVEDALDPGNVGAPLSLQRAVATFLIALVVSQLRGTPRPLTMLIHPSAARELHSVYERWVQAVLDRVSAALSSGDDEHVRQLSASLMQPAYEDLASTGGTTLNGQTVSLATILEQLLDYLEETKVLVINSEDGNEIGASDWSSQPGWIVVGGNKLDRGFTVQNLAVTYMPRGPGIRNADTVQQRGRFFGYKQGYVDLLRAWLNPETAEVYESYVRHESAMRAELQELDDRSTPLRDWRRHLLLARDMNPTRAAVISLDTSTTRMDAGWAFTQDALYSEAVAPDADTKNRVRRLSEQSEVDSRDRRTGPSRNRRTMSTWSSVAELLLDWPATPVDRARLDAVLYALAGTADDLEVEIVLIDGADPSHPRLRGPDQRASAALAAAMHRLDLVDDADALRIGQLMQGANPAGTDKYPGDRAFRDPDAVTVQIHAVAPTLTPDASSGTAERPVVFALAVHLPDTLDRVIQGPAA